MEQIFFRDKHGELKGPFTEHQVQDWYREKWFDGGIPFYFLKNGEQPTGETPSLTLAELQSRYGIGCPFARTGDCDRVQMEHLQSMEEQVESLRAETDQVKQMESRLSAMEEQLKNLENPVEALPEPSESPPVMTVQPVPVVVDNAAKKRNRPINASGVTTTASGERIPQWVPDCTEFFLDGYDALATNSDPASYWLNENEWKCHEMRLVHIMADPDSKALLLKELEKAVSERAYLYCAPCDQILQNYKLAFLHLTDPSHEARATVIFPIWAKLTDLLVDFFDIHLTTRWLNADLDKQDALKKRFHNVPVNSPTLRPSIDFIIRLQNYKRELWANNYEEDNMTVPQRDQKMAKIQGDWGNKIMVELEEHVKDSQTRCLTCSLVCGSVPDFYDHLIGPGHMRRASALDLLTLIVNAHKKHLVK